MENDQNSSPIVNRVAIPLSLIEAQDTTLVYAQIQKALRGRKDLNRALKFINHILIGLIVAAAFYLIYVVITGLSMQKIKPLKPVEAGQVQILTPADFPSVELSTLQEFTSTRSLFEPMALQGPAQNAAADSVRTELYAKLRIVGVMIDQPSKAILEVISSGQTVFMLEGDQVEGAELKKISENKLLFVYNGMEVELSR